MLHLLKVICVRGFKKRISLPDRFFILTPDSMLFTYFIGGRTRFISIEGKENVAEFLLSQNIIVSYSFDGGSLKMIEEKLFTVTGNHNQPIQWSRTTELPWDKIKFFQSDVIHFAAQHEYEIQGSVMGINNVRVINSTLTIFPKAA